MRFKRHIKLEKGLRQIDIAPLIDIVFQLLIFFMLTSNFIARPPGIRVNLPQAKSAEAAPGPQKVVSVSAEGIIYLNGELVTLKELRGRLKALGGEDTVFIRADKGCLLGRVVAVWDLCRDLGIYKVTIGAEGKGGRR